MKLGIHEANRNKTFYIQKGDRRDKSMLVPKKSGLPWEKNTISQIGAKVW